MSDSNIIHVDFHGDSLECAQRDGRIWVAVRRVCDALGVSVQPQLTKLRDKPWATITMIVTVAEDGKPRETACIDLDSLPMWLATLNPRKVSDEVRGKIELYQRECAKVLRDHFLGTPTLAPVGLSEVLTIVANTSQCVANLTATVNEYVADGRVRQATVDTKLDGLATEQQSTTKRLALVESKIDAISPKRRGFSRESQRRFRGVIRDTYSGKCPCCLQADVLSKSTVAEFDHFNGNPGDNRAANGWLICRECHDEKRSSQAAMRGHFDSFQARLARHPGSQLTLFESK